MFYIDRPMDVACLLIREFLVALARRDDPRLAKRAVIIGGSPEEHARVRACSREALEVGVELGMTLRRALALCPKAVFLPYQESYAAGEAARLLSCLQEFSPAIEVLAPGHLHFDIRGLARMNGVNDEAFLSDLHESTAATCGLPVHLAGAETVFAAHAAAVTGGTGSRTAGSVALVPAGQAKTYLAALPVEVLPVPPAMHLRLRLFGLERLGQFSALGFSSVQAQFGREGARAWELANGRDDSFIVPQREELRISEEIEMPAPATSIPPLLAGTQVLLQRALEHRDLKGHSLRRLDWRAVLESGEEITRRFVFREPTNDPVRMLFVVKNRLERLQLPAPVGSLGVTLSGLCSEYGHQQNLWQIGPKRYRELMDAIAQLNAREGGPQIFRIVEVQPWSRIPERQLALAAFSG